VPLDTDTEVFHLRALLRDLVALSAIPGVWVERAATLREPGTEAVAAELADALVRLLELDFAFVRLRDPDGAGAADVTRGSAWKRFPEWLERHMTAGARKEIVADVGDGPEPCRGVAIPIGLNGEGGVVAAASMSGDFPTATDQLVLSLAANQAATAFQSACLIHERRRAEGALREAQIALEVKVAERTAELGRSEAYLAQAQRLTHTGSFAIDASTGEVTHASDELSRLYAIDPEHGTPSLSEFLQRVPRQDRAMCIEALERGIREATTVEVEYRVVLPDAPVGHHRAIAHPVFGATGELDEIVGTIVDVTERRQTQTELERLAGEQAALRQVATLVAQGTSPTAVFDGVVAEMVQLLGASGVTLSRYEPGEEVTVVAHCAPDVGRVPPGTRVSHEGENVTTMVRRSERPARMEHYEGTHGTIAGLVKDLGVRASVGTPIVVEGRLWGVAIATWRGDESPPAHTEERMAQFAQLLDTAIANADSRDQLTASRARLLTEGDEARRRVVRDLHDGAQQRFVQTIILLKLALRSLREKDGEAESLVSEALQHADQGNAELRELAHGILPAVLTRGGLRAGVDAVVTRLDLPVHVNVPAERFPPEIEASAYFIVAEALTNVVKHAHAAHAEVRASMQHGMLHVEVRDDGIGGADPEGHGLVGIRDRAAAFGGLLKLESPAGGGTLVAATLPLSAQRAQQLPHVRA
jgi:signal transduction histidine kinase/PAS domain-containing protein